MVEEVDADLRARVLAGMREVYQRQASLWDATRGKRLSERQWLDRLLGFTSPGDCVLDLGCGGGAPIAGYFVAASRRVWGVDYSSAMLSLARERFPDETWIEGDMRRLALGRRFAAIIGWDSFFHLTAIEQKEILPRLAEHLVPGGGLLLTVGPQAGETLGTVGGEPVYHASLAPDEYRVELSRAGLEMIDFVAEDATSGRSVLMARRSEG